MANTQGTWKLVTPRLGAQPITEVSTTQKHPFGTRLVVKDQGGTTTYGEAEFVYVKGVASGAVAKWASYVNKSGLTVLAVANTNGHLGVFVSTLDATTKFGWLQIKGRCIGKSLTAYADAGIPYLTATAGSVDDASVAGDWIWGAIGANGGTHTVGDLAGEFEINYPYAGQRVSVAG